MTTDIQTESAMGYLQADHRRLDALMNDCKALVQAGDTKAAAARFEEFRQGLMRHIKIEEGLLFPEFEAAMGLDRSGGPTGVMRSEHAEIIRMLELVRELFAEPRPDAEEFERLRSALTGLLHEHNGKEERILYPMTDQMVEPVRLKDLVRKMRAF